LPFESIESFEEEEEGVGVMDVDVDAARSFSSSEGSLITKCAGSVANVSSSD
jgi:putative methionine-R-sulfoxide reductase with GAF domain